VVAGGAARDNAARSEGPEREHRERIRPPSR
jgi:hypothetical protein